MHIDKDCAKAMKNNCLAKTTEQRINVNLKNEQNLTPYGRTN